MPRFYFWRILKSNFCKIVFLAGFFGAYLLLPDIIFHGNNRFLALVYMLVFASLLTCIVRAVKEKASLLHKSGLSLLGLLAAIIGISAFHICGVSAPVCGAAIGAGIVSIFAPGFLLPLLDGHSQLMIYLSIAIQLLALYHLKCFKKYA